MKINNGRFDTEQEFIDAVLLLRTENKMTNIEIAEDVGLSSYKLLATKITKWKKTIDIPRKGVMGMYVDSHKEEFILDYNNGKSFSQLAIDYKLTRRTAKVRATTWKLEKRTITEKEELTQEVLKKLLDYNKDTGVFTWKEARGTITIGDTAGTVNKGYTEIRLFSVGYKAHRLAFLYVDGKFPPKDKDVDHENHIRDDNSWNNLKIVSGKENGMNQSMKKNNTSGQSGVYFRKDTKKWVVKIKNPEDGSYFIKQFENKHKAIAVAKAMYVFYGYHENHGEQSTEDYYTDSRQELIDKQTPKDVDLELLKAIKENCPKGYQMDHIEPLSKGGLHEPDNLQYITEEENQSKGNKYPYECKTTILPEDII